MNKICSAKKHSWWNTGNSLQSRAIKSFQKLIYSRNIKKEMQTPEYKAKDNQILTENVGRLWKG